MKTLVIGSFLVLFAIIGGVLAAPTAYADHPTASVSIPAGTAVPGCEETDECYIPADVSVDVGGEVTWSNDDSAAHTVTSGTKDGGPDGNFDSGLFLAGATYSYSFDEAGEYPYFCLVHPWMEGTVTVESEHGDGGAGGSSHTEDSMKMEDGEHMEDSMKMEDGEHMEDSMKMEDGEHMDMEDSVSMENSASVTGMLSDGTEVKIWATEPAAGEMMKITIEFEGAEHVNHDITVTQNGEEVLGDMDAHHHEGVGEHMTAALSSDDPVDIVVTFQGYGINDLTGPIGEEVTFTNVVPEFGTIAAMILAVAIVSIIAVTARSRLSLAPRI